jgi:hypothetical protein
MEGKLKEKLESTGIALLCMAISKSYSNPLDTNCINFFLKLNKDFNNFLSI